MLETQRLGQLAMLELAAGNLHNLELFIHRSKITTPHIFDSHFGIAVPPGTCRGANTRLLLRNARILSRM